MVTHTQETMVIDRSYYINYNFDEECEIMMRGIMKPKTYSMYCRLLFPKMCEIEYEK